MFPGKVSVRGVSAGDQTSEGEAGTETRRLSEWSWRSQKRFSEEMKGSGVSEARKVPERSQGPGPRFEGTSNGLQASEAEKMRRLGWGLSRDLVESEKGRGRGRGMSPTAERSTSGK